VVIRSSFGHDKIAGVDIRGMGDTYVSNVIVMVDGYRLNPPDLAGPDFSSISLDQVEKIEIIRGAGSVVYGDGAVGGVINIITKKGKKKPQLRLYSSYGSYDTFDGRASWRGMFKSVYFNVNADYYSSDGYRDNGFFRKKDGGMNLDYDLGERITLSLRASTHRDSYGLPAYVSKDDIDSREKRTLTFRPDDSGDTGDDRLMAGFEIDLGDWGTLEIHRGYRFRDNFYLMGYTPLLSRAEQTDHINENTRLFDLGYSKEYELFKRSNTLRVGIDHFKTEYFREENSRNQRKNSEVKTLGFFITNRMDLSHGLSLHLGYRRNTFKGVFRNDQHVNFGGKRIWVNGDPYSKKWKNRAWDVGLVYEINPDHTLFADYATSFRSPNVDELALADDDLHPQKGKHLEFGSRHSISDRLEFSLTLFRTVIKDEIYYDGSGFGLNRNYDDKTVRRGIEADLKLYLTDSFFFWGNCSLLSAKFEEKNTRIPLVPERKVSMGIEWRITGPLLLSLTGTWAGSSPDGNDQNNDMYQMVHGYKVFDGKLTYKREQFKLFFGVNNIFDELYSTVAYSETYYPMPTRNIYGGMEWTF
ncbi:MAG: TonB-dependent receptor, partial [Deltaproteobacteria bacterium]|nr:TonB-dependent receptor [Deltaproteobacteria bacterium]